MINYLKHTSLPLYYENILWSISPYTGTLYRGKININANESQKIPDKVSKALELCNYPYCCSPNEETNNLSYDGELLNRVNIFHDRFLKISNKYFYLNRLYASIKYPIFDSTTQAISHINNLPIQIKERHSLCLQRSFLAAKISDSFIRDGVIFIGAFLPTGDMHAWIIEKDMQPDYSDRGWINYRPLLALYH